MSSTHYRLIYKKGSFSQTELDQGQLDHSPKDPRNLSNWRPIALINCGAKLLSTYIASHLKHGLTNLIDINQTAFVPGRSIHDNIMLIQLLMHHYGVTKEYAGLLFIDFTHAYDWPYGNNVVLLCMKKIMIRIRIG